jgi:hypothetical protein
MGYYITTTTIYDDKLSRINTSTVTPSILAAYITDAENVINSYIAKQYNIASVTVSRPPTLRTIAKDLTIYYTLLDAYTQDNQNFNDWIQRRGERAFELLNAIRDDDIRLFTDSGVAISPISPEVGINMKSSTKGYELTINMDTYTSWAVPDDLLTEIAADR